MALFLSGFAQIVIFVPNMRLELELALRLGLVGSLLLVWIGWTVWCVLLSPNRGLAPVGARTAIPTRGMLKSEYHVLVAVPGLVDEAETEEHVLEQRTQPASYEEQAAQRRAAAEERRKAEMERIACEAKGQ